MRILAALLISMTLATANPLIWLSGKPSATAAASFSDDMQRADETPLSKSGAWLTGPGASDTVNLVGFAYAQGTTPGIICIARVVTPAFANNQSSTITLHSSVIEVAPAVRIQGSTDPSCCYAYMAGTTVVRVYKVDSSLSSFTQIGSDYTISAVGSGDTITLSASGTSTTTLELFRNGVSQGTRTDSSSPITGGQPGFLTLGPAKLLAYSATDL